MNDKCSTCGVAAADMTAPDTCRGGAFHEWAMYERTHGGVIISERDARDMRRAAKAAEPFRDGATITATDDGMVRTHDDAQTMLRYAVPGARVEFWRPPTAGDRTRGYSITIRRDYGQRVEPVFGAYTLPAPAETLARHAVDQTRKATEATR